MVTNSFGGKTIESDSFGITLSETFRTASFGGAKLEAGGPTVTNAPKLDLG